MYLVYLRDMNGNFVGSVDHPSTQEEAGLSFARLVNNTAYDGFDLVAVLVENKRPIATHRYGQLQQGADDGAQSWRGRLDKLPFSSLH